MQAVLEVTAGPHSGRKIVLSQGVPVRIGRTPKSDYVVAEDTFLSGAHFYVEWSGAQCVVRDMSSSNGTFLNGTRMNEGLVRDGDIITAGQSSFALRLDPFADLTPAPPAADIQHTQMVASPFYQRDVTEQVTEKPGWLEPEPLMPVRAPLPFGAPPPPPPPFHGSPEPPAMPAAVPPPTPPFNAPTPFSDVTAYSAPPPFHAPPEPPPMPGSSLFSAPPPFSEAPAYNAPPPFHAPPEPPPMPAAPPPVPPPMPSSGPDLSAVQQGMLDVLRGLADPIYAVLDCSAAASFIDAARATGSAVEVLPESSSACVASLNPESPQAAQLAAEGWGKNWGIYITSRQPLPIVRNHLRRFQVLLSQDGVEFQFRFHSPTLLRAFLPTLNVEEAKTLFGPIGAILIEGNTPDNLLLFVRGPEGTLEKTLPLTSGSAAGA
jgi:Domain of unknown function (DUF4123)/FHA domain